MSLNETTGSPLNLPETWEECVELGMPDTAEARGHWERARKAEATILAALQNARPMPQYAKKVEPAHKLSEDERRARRTRNRSKRRKASERLTAPQKGKRAWKARAKEKRKLGWTPTTQLQREKSRPLWKETSGT